jgi:hypothetical protein
VWRNSYPNFKYVIEYINCYNIFGWKLLIHAVSLKMHVCFELTNLILCSNPQENGTSIKVFITLENFEYIKKCEQP